MKMASAILTAPVLVLLLTATARGADDRLIPASEASRMVAVAEARSEGGVVSGVVINNSDEVARDVQLLIRDTWLWNNERHPGENSPGRAEFYILPGPIAPHGNLGFRYQEQPLPERADGHFTTQVQVVGFTQVGSSEPLQSLR
jgi:hypothetical protein